MRERERKRRVRFHISKYATVREVQLAGIPACNSKKNSNLNGPKQRYDDKVINLIWYVSQKWEEEEKNQLQQLSYIVI